jgi:hypothetical protein
MENSLLIEMLRLLQRNEKLALRKYLQSPYHNTRVDVCLLYDFMAAKTNLKLENLSDRKTIFQAVYKDSAYDSKKLNYVVSYLIKLIESFIAQEAYARNESERLLTLVRGFRRGHWLALSERSARTAAKKLEKQTHRNAAYHRQYFHLLKETMLGQLQQSRSKAFDFNSINEAHEKAFFIEKMQLGCMIQSRSAVANKTFDTGFLPVMLAFLKDHPWLQEPALSAWYHGFQMHTAAEPDLHFENLKKVIFEHGLLFNDLERHDLFLLAVNFCIRRINSGDSAFSRDLFDLYREGMHQDVFLENGMISRWTYNNIVNSALKTSEIAWAIRFLEENRAKLEPAFRDTSYYFNLARCLYEKGDYSTALECLTRMEYDDVLQNLSAKTLQIKIYYDMQAWQALDSLLDSVSIYIRRKKVLGYHKENFSNNLRFMQRLMSIPPGDRAARLQLQHDVENCKVLTERSWFLGKLNH